MIDRETKDWILTPADEAAARAGMRFDAERGEFACDWMETYCCLYEGSLAGQPLALYPAQREFFMRLYGWVRWSGEWEEWVRRFTHGALWMAKKNGKSPMAAAHNLYLLCGDNEPGQKVYMMAHDGQQARIAQKHAINMVQQSPLLKAECKINNTTLEIEHLPSRSVLQVVTGDNKRQADSKHGYNGSVTIDEMHVVTRPMMDAVGRAGISRKEPLQVSFSTAGTDPSSVGFERCQYGRQVNSGERKDPHFLHVEYAAPQKATAAEIEQHLDEYGEAANPSWGILVKPSEFRADWERSKSDPRKCAILMQERLDIWVGSVSRWLDQAAWERGARKYTLADLAGRPCFLGFDAARKLDMNAAVFLFPWPEGGEECLRIWPMFWLPEQTAAERDHLFPFKSWGMTGHLNITPGGTMDYTRVKGDLRAAITENRLKVLCMYYDEHYANEITQALHEGERLGPTVVEGVVGARKEVSQGIMTMTTMCCDFERRLKAGMIQHPDNLVMNWQVGHCEVRRDRLNNIAPEKPKEGTGKNIDGVAALLDGMVGVLEPPEDATNVYDTREPLIF